MINKDNAVLFHYTLTDDNGEVIDTSVGEDALMYVHGYTQIVPGLEAAMAERSAGDTFQLSIPPEQGYGEYDEELLQTFPRSDFDDVENLGVGMQFEAEANNEELILTLVEMKENEVVLDANHPLAGATLNFDIEIVEVRDATKEELEMAQEEAEEDEPALH